MRMILIYPPVKVLPALKCHTGLKEREIGLFIGFAKGVVLC